MIRARSRGAVPISLSMLVILSMPLLFRNPTGELSSSEGLIRLGEAVALVDSLSAEGSPGSPFTRLLIQLAPLIPEPLTP